MSLLEIHVELGNALQLRTIPQEFPEPVGGFPEWYSLRNKEWTISQEFPGPVGGFPEMYSLRNKELTDPVMFLAVLGDSGTRS
jgi:hypothetical protein